AAEKLRKEGKKVRVVNMFSAEIFEKQSAEYKEKVLPSSISKRIIVEAGSPFGWHKYAKTEGVIIGVDSFGVSAPGDTVLANFGFTVENIINTVNKL
ncbi:MAG TPA: transketolase, partial [bacterium]|nr:transketolase [bacterium]